MRPDQTSSVERLAPYAVNRETRGPDAAEGRMTAATACRACGTELREGARFCDGCGAPVTEQDTRAKYKQVTVLFAELVIRQRDTKPHNP
jgi:hypothetical protein